MNGSPGNHRRIGADGESRSGAVGRRTCATRRAIGHNVVVQFWKPHSLATPHDGPDRPEDRRQVRTTAELHGVPVGTQGRILLANGFNWQRYRVLFDNGAEFGDLDHRNIEPIGRAAKRVAKRAKAEARRG